MNANTDFLISQNDFFKTYRTKFSTKNGVVIRFQNTNEN